MPTKVTLKSGRGKVKMMSVKYDETFLRPCARAQNRLDIDRREAVPLRSPGQVHHRVCHQGSRAETRTPVLGSNGG